jgi:hypothetical protein
MTTVLAPDSESQLVILSYEFYENMFVHNAPSNIMKEAILFPFREAEPGTSTSTSLVLLRAGTCLGPHVWASSSAFPLRPNMIYVTDQLLFDRFLIRHTPGPQHAS